MIYDHLVPKRTNKFVDAYVFRGFTEFNKQVYLSLYYIFDGNCGKILYLIYYTAKCGFGKFLFG